MLSLCQNQLTNSHQCFSTFDTDLAEEIMQHISEGFI